MQVLRHRHLNILGIRYLYSASFLGVDNFVKMRNKIKGQFEDIEDKFKLKMKDFAVPESMNMIFTEDLKHMLHLTEGTGDDLSVVKQMMLKFAQQNKDLRFGSFIFGPVVMRMYYHLNQPVEALEVFRMLENEGFFDQLVSYQILMDLLLNNNMLAEIIEVFEIVKKKQLHGSKYPKNAVVLVLAACYMQNTKESFEYTKQLWSDLNQVGHFPMRRAGTFAAALAIQQNAPEIALEILTSMKNQTYVTIRNLKVSALADIGRPDDAMPILHAILDTDRPVEKKSTLCEEVVTKLRISIENLGRNELTKEFGQMEEQLRSLGHISNKPLSDHLCTEIQLILQLDTGKRTKPGYRQQSNYHLRPGLQNMA